MGEFSFPRLIAAVKRWPLAIASWINDPRLDRLRHLAKIHQNEPSKHNRHAVTLCLHVRSVCPPLVDIGLGNPTSKNEQRSFDRWRCRNGGPVRSVYISWLNSPTIKRERPYGRERSVGRTF